MARLSESRPRRAAVRLVIVIMLCLSSLTLGVLPAGAVQSPDAHDRAAALRLSARFAIFQEIASRSSLGSNQLKDCAFIRAHPSEAFAAAFSALPVVLIEVVQRFEPQLTGLRSVFATLHPDSALFARWLAAENTELELILSFDNHGQPIDLCTAVTVLLAKNPTVEAVRHVLGIDPRLLASLFSKRSQQLSETLSALDPTMRTFFIAAGMPRVNAVALTSSG